MAIAKPPFFPAFSLSRKSPNREDLILNNIAGDKYIQEDLLGLKFRISPHAFFQVIFHDVVLVLQLGLTDGLLKWIFRKREELPIFLVSPALKKKEDKNLSELTVNLPVH